MLDKKKSDQVNIIFIQMLFLFIPSSYKTALRVDVRGFRDGGIIFFLIILSFIGDICRAEASSAQLNIR